MPQRHITDTLRSDWRLTSLIMVSETGSHPARALGYSNIWRVARSRKEMEMISYINMQCWALWTPPCGPAGRRSGMSEAWECVTYLHRSCRRDKGTSTHFLSRWRTLHTRAGNQTSPSSSPCWVSPLSFGPRGSRRDPAPQTGLLV